MERPDWPSTSGCLIDVRAPHPKVVPRHHQPLHWQSCISKAKLHLKVQEVLVTIPRLWWTGLRKAYISSNLLKREYNEVKKIMLTVDERLSRIEELQITILIKFPRQERIFLESQLPEFRVLHMSSMLFVGEWKSPVNAPHQWDQTMGSMDEAQAERLVGSY